VDITTGKSGKDAPQGIVSFQGHPGIRSSGRPGNVFLSAQAGPTAPIVKTAGGIGAVGQIWLSPRTTVLAFLTTSPCSHPHVSVLLRKADFPQHMGKTLTAPDSSS
jgi:hypothetical protein